MGRLEHLPTSKSLSVITGLTSHVELFENVNSSKSYRFILVCHYKTKPLAFYGNYTATAKIQDEVLLNDLFVFFKDADCKLMLRQKERVIEICPNGKNVQISFTLKKRF